MDDQWTHIAGCWQGWISAAAVRHDAEEVKRRLAQVPESMREQVRSHARTVWQLSATSASGGSKRARR